MVQPAPLIKPAPTRNNKAVCAVVVGGTVPDRDAKDIDQAHGQYNKYTPGIQAFQLEITPLRNLPFQMEKKSNNTELQYYDTQFKIGEIGKFTVLLE